jgi:DNA-binding SARP family transcriptional activator/tetratricopeptide (TPR) repeat protein
MRIMLLGPVTVAAGGHRYTLRRSQTRGLLALLALHAGEPVSIDAAIEAMWGGQAPRTARTRIQDSIATIRRSLQNWGARDCVERGRFGYMLRLPADAVDALELAAGLREARGLVGRDADPDKAIARYREALALWAGEPLADASGSFVDGARTRLVEQHLGGIESVAELELARGEHASVAAELAALADSHPLRERLTGTLMLALYRGGDRPAALALYRRCRAELAGTLGLEPGGELQRLHRAILSADPGLAIAAAGPIHAQRVRPAQLPSAPATFVGRERLLAQVEEARRDGIAIITGRGGVGKTALAVTWAHSAVGQFPDGQLYVNLRGFSPGQPLAPVVAASGFLRALGVPGQQIPPGEDEVTARLRTELSGRRMLMLLDNAASAAQVRPLLPGEPSVVVLITSRDRLSGLAATHGAPQISLGSLELRDAIALLHKLLPDRRLTPEEAAELAKLCGCLPLALRIAAARLRDEPGLRALRTGTRLGELAIDGDPDATIRATFDLSYARLEKSQRRIFRFLGLVPGGDFDATAVAQLAGTIPARARKQLAGLVAAHLVDAVDENRYAMHDLLHAYAAERVAAEESSEAIRDARKRLFEWLLGMARAAAGLLSPEVPLLPGTAADTGWTRTADALMWTESELPNLIGAVAIAPDAGLAEYAWLLPDAMRTFFWHSGRQTEWLGTATQAVEAATIADDPAALAAAHLNLAWYHFVHGRDEDAREHYGQAARYAQDTGWVEGRISALNGVARAERDLGLLPDALTHLRQALSLEYRGPARESISQGLLASVYLSAGELDESLHHAQIAAAAPISQVGMAAHLVILAEVHRARGETDAAAGRFGAALQIFEELGHRAGKAKCRTGLGAIALDGGRYSEAFEHLDQAVTLARETEDTAAEAAALRLLDRLAALRL